MVDERDTDRLRGVGGRELDAHDKDVSLLITIGAGAV